MAIKYMNPNLGKSPFDPEYQNDFNPEKEWEAYEQALIEAAEYKMEQ